MSKIIFGRLFNGAHRRQAFYGTLLAFSRKKIREPGDLGDLYDLGDVCTERIDLKLRNGYRNESEG